MNGSAVALNQYAKLDEVTQGDFDLRMQKSLRVLGQGEKFVDLVIIVNEDEINEWSVL